MKILLITIATALFLNAEMGLMTPNEHSSVHEISKRPALKIKSKQNMHRIHKVEESEAKKIIKEATGEDITSLKLTHLGRELFYSSSTKSYSLKVNALTGEIMEKKKND